MKSRREYFVHVVLFKIDASGIIDVEAEEEVEGCRDVYDTLKEARRAFDKVRGQTAGYLDPLGKGYYVHVILFGVEGDNVIDIDEAPVAGYPEVYATHAEAIEVFDRIKRQTTPEYLYTGP